MSCDKSSRTMTKETLHKLQKKENQAKELSNLTSSQLEAIIGVSLNDWICHSMKLPVMHIVKLTNLIYIIIYNYSLL